MPPLLDAIRQRVATAGPIGFDEYVAHALYAPALGFYAAGGGAGRRRDFITSPEVGPLYGAVVAAALDTWWDDLGRPDPYLVVEAGAGPGTLARSILKASPRCGAALELVLVEPAEVQWNTHPEGVTTRTDLPGPGELGPGPAVVLANELLDNLPFALVERTGQGWAEVRVGASRDGGLTEVLVGLDAVRSTWCSDRAGGAVEVGARLPVQADAASWLGDALRLIDEEGGRVAVVDYASTTAEMASRPWTDWLRTYEAHGRSGHPLDAPGRCDITVEVAVDQLALVRAPFSNRTQAEFLTDHGIDSLVAEGRRIWERDGLAGGLGAIAGRSRSVEAEALRDPGGLGSFRVLEWTART